MTTDPRNHTNRSTGEETMTDENGQTIEVTLTGPEWACCVMCARDAKRVVAEYEAPLYPGDVYGPLPLCADHHDKNADKRQTTRLKWLSAESFADNRCACTLTDEYFLDGDPFHEVAVDPACSLHGDADRPRYATDEVIAAALAAHRDNLAPITEADFPGYLD